MIREWRQRIAHQKSAGHRTGRWFAFGAYVWTVLQFAGLPLPWLWALPVAAVGYWAGYFIGKENADG